MESKGTVCVCVYGYKIIYIASYIVTGIEVVRVASVVGGIRHLMHVYKDNMN